MRDKKNQILSPELLRQDEAEKVRLLLVVLQEFIKSVPVAHFDHDSGGTTPIFQKNANGTEGFFNDDYSYLYENSSHTGVELVKMIRIFSNYINNISKRLRTDKKGTLKRVEIWKLFVREIPTYLKNLTEEELHKCKKEYCTFVKSQMDLFDSVTMPLSLILERKSPCDTPSLKFASLFYSKKFRDNASDPELNYLCPQDDKSKNFFITINNFRNRGEHWALSPFNPPSDDEGEYEHYRQMHLRMILYFMIIFDRFYDELWDIIVSENDIINMESLGEQPHEESKRLLKQLYIKRVHKEAEARMMSLFHGTGLTERKGLLSDLPEVLLSRQNERGGTIVGDCVEMLVDDAGSKRKIVVGNAGSGKTVMFLRMIRRNQPMLTPFYIELKDFDTADYLPRLQKMVIGEDRLIITKYVFQATLERVRSLLESGSAVFFIDSAEAAPGNQKYLEGFIRKYPECQYIIATQQETVPNKLKDLGFQRYDVRPFDEVQAKDLMRLMSLHISNVDHTERLSKEMHHISQDIARNPLTLTQLIYLYEKDSKSMGGNISKPMLFWKLYESLAQDDVQLLKERYFMQQLFTDIDQISSLCAEVVSMYEADPKSDWVSRILDNELVRNDLKRFFDIMEIVALSREELSRTSVVFRTLVTMAVLEKEMSSVELPPRITFENGEFSFNKDELPMPNPALQNLSKAIQDLPFISPSRGDLHNSEELSDNCRITYRLQPKYILRQYLISLLNIYRKAGANIKNSPAQITALFDCIAYSGDEELLNMLFSPYWLRQWLINKNDKDLLGINVYGGLNSPLRQTLVGNCVSPHILAVLMLRQLLWVYTWGMVHTGNLLEGSLFKIIVDTMNDDQKEKFVDMLPELDGLLEPSMLGYYKNLAISSMDFIYLLDRFDWDNDLPLGNQILELLKSKGNYFPALKILLSQFEKLILTQDQKQYDLNKDSIAGLLTHLVRNGVLKTQSLKDRFWEIMRKCPRSIRRYLDKIPIEDILPDIAFKEYDKSVWEHLMKLYAIEEKRLADWVEPVYCKTNKELYLPVSEKGGRAPKRRSVQYTFYSQPEDSLFLVATECMDEMPEHKFCQIKNQWFYVEDVIVLGKEAQIDSIAEITVNLPSGCQRRRKGTLVMGDGKKINYIHEFEHGASRQVVVRVDSSDALSWLSETGRIESLKQDRNILFNGVNAILGGIEIRQVSEHMRLVLLRPVSDGGHGFYAQTVKISGIPMSGSLVFYPKNDMAKCPDPKGLLLKIQSDAPCFADRASLKGAVYLGVELGVHYFISETGLNVGNHLMWSECNHVGEIILNYTLTPRSDRSSLKVPSCILNNMDEILASSSDPLHPKVVHLYVMIVHQPDRSYHHGELYRPGSVMKPADVKFYHPVAKPHRTAWKPIENKITVDSVTGIFVEIDGITLLSVPKTSYPSSAKYYSTSESSVRMKIKWHTLDGDGRRYDNRMLIVVEPKVRRLMQKENSVYFFENAVGGNALKIRFNRLSDLIDVAKSTRYHERITPLLIKEWMIERHIDNFKYQFCKNKHYVGELIQECVSNKVPIPESWQLNICYVVEVKDNAEAVLFTPPQVFSNKEQLAEGCFDFTGIIPKGLKPGDMVIREKNKLTVLTVKCIEELSKYETNGFRRGVVSRRKKNDKIYLNIICKEIQGMWFTPYKHLPLSYDGKEVIFFPMVFNNIPTALHVMIKK